MKALFILQNDMSLKNGGSICSKLYLDLFNDICDDLYVMLPKQNNYAWDFSDYKLLEIPQRSKLNKIISIFAGSPHRFYPYIYNFRNIIEQVDFIVLSSSILGYGILDFMHQFNKPTICIHHNYEPDFHKDNKTIISLWGLNINRIRQIEKDVLNRTAFNITLTKSDELKFKQNYSLDEGVKIETVGCFLEKKQIKEKISEVNNNKIVISGALCDKQTEDGIIYYLKYLHPIVCSYMPNVEVCIAGRNPSNKLKQYISNLNNIILKENPPQLNEVIKDAILFINPTFSGSGLKLRNMDPLKLGIPVLAHKKSCAGYEKLIKLCVWQYNSDAEFKEQLICILNKKLKREEIQNIFYEKFSYEKALFRIKEITQIYL